MTINEVREILNGTFADENDRKYWETKLKEMIAKAETAEENERYFKELAVYNR